MIDNYAAAKKIIFPDASETTDEEGSDDDVDLDDGLAERQAQQEQLEPQEQQAQQAARETANIAAVRAQESAYQNMQDTALPKLRPSAPNPALWVPQTAVVIWPYSKDSTSASNEQHNDL